jgi:hypothetical protein
MFSGAGTTAGTDGNNEVVTIFGNGGCRTLFFAIRNSAGYPADPSFF